MIALKSTPRKSDFTLLILALTLTCIGILMVFDASYAYLLQRHMSQFKYVAQQAMWGMVGIGVLAWAMYFPYWRWRNAGVYAVAASFILLVMVFAPGVGIAAKGAHRWVGHGAFRIQPSEFAKVAVVLYVARVCAGRLKVLSRFSDGALPPLLVVGLLAATTAIEPDLGTCLVILGSGIGTMFFAGMKIRHLAATLVGLVVLGGLFFAVKSLHHHTDSSASIPGAAASQPQGGSFQLKRLMVFLHPEEDKQGDGYQVYHSTLALGTGGLLGMGIGEGREKMYLPEAHTDFIFAILGEEGGLIASLTMLLLLGCLVARGFHIAAVTKDPYGSLLAAGLSLIIGLQTFMNIGVVTSSIPATGVPLPFISYGGSSLVITLLMVGILLNIAKHPDGDPDKLGSAGERVGEREFELRWNRGQTLSRPEYRDDGGYANRGSGSAARTTPPFDSPGSRRR